MRDIFLTFCLVCWKSEEKGDNNSFTSMSFLYDRILAPVLLLYLFLHGNNLGCSVFSSFLINSKFL